MDETKDMLDSEIENIYSNIIKGKLRNVQVCNYHFLTFFLKFLYNRKTQ